MAKIKDFVDLIAWQSARNLAVLIEKLVAEERFSTNYSLREQVRRSSISVSSNIAEGFGRGGNREFINFLSIARGSLAELKSQIILAYEFGYLNKEEHQTLSEMILKTGNMIGGLIRHLKKSKVSGSKFKRGGDQ